MSRYLLLKNTTSSLLASSSVQTIGYHIPIRAASTLAPVHSHGPHDSSHDSSISSRSRSLTILSVDSPPLPTSLPRRPLRGPADSVFLRHHISQTSRGYLHPSLLPPSPVSSASTHPFASSHEETNHTKSSGLRRQIIQSGKDHE